MLKDEHGVGGMRRWGSGDDVGAGQLWGIEKAGAAGISPKTTLDVGGGEETKVRGYL